uniref:uncharacterized protein n=1 Tax=Myxine glutinosa TaxID=7769 RepID=UPI00358FF44C
MKNSVTCIALASILFAQTMVVLPKPCGSLAMTSALTILMNETKKNIQKDATLTVKNVTTSRDEQTLCRVLLQVWFYAEALRNYSKKFGEGMVKKNLTKLANNIQQNIEHINIKSSNVWSRFQMEDAASRETKINIHEVFSHMKELWNFKRFHGHECSCDNFSINDLITANPTPDQQQRSEEWLTKFGTFLLGMATSTLLIGMVYMLKNKVNKHRLNYTMNTNLAVDESEEEQISGNAMFEITGV